MNRLMFAMVAVVTAIAVNPLAANAALDNVRRLKTGLSANSIVLINYRKVEPAPKGQPTSRLAEYPALRAYVDSLSSIPAGTFNMGEWTNVSDHHRVTLSPFRMGATPVTVAVWKEYCAATGISLPSAPSWGWLDDHPVVNVSWNDIMGADGKGGFCAWASDVAGFRLTLPTEAQWEYSARGGTLATYPWGGLYMDNLLWCSKVTNRLTTAPVNRSTNIYRNAFGLMDVVGNVFQWCSDHYGPYLSGHEKDPSGPTRTPGYVRCIRGGAWNYSVPDLFQCGKRSWVIPDMKGSALGFRLSAGPS